MIGTGILSNSILNSARCFITSGFSVIRVMNSISMHIVEVKVNIMILPHYYFVEDPNKQSGRGKFDLSIGIS